MVIGVLLKMFTLFAESRVFALVNSVIVVRLFMFLAFVLELVAVRASFKGEC